jgi:Polyketide cyclase / dehydrase and lipid transport
MWSVEHSLDTRARPATVFDLYRDVAGWPRWDAGLERMQLDGPFAVGTTGTMVVAGQPPLRLRLVWVEEGRGFEDETTIPDAGVVVHVRHELQPLEHGGTRITHTLSVQGPNADTLGPTIGPAISADFPQTLAALARLAEASPSRR